MRLSGLFGAGLWLLAAVIGMFVLIHYAKSWFEHEEHPTLALSVVTVSFTATHLVAVGLALGMSMLGLDLSGTGFMVIRVLVLAPVSVVVFDRMLRVTRPQAVALAAVTMAPAALIGILLNWVFFGLIFRL